MPSRSHPDGQFLAIGELLLDLIVADGASDLSQAGAFAARAGGAPANAAVAMARLGLPAAFAGVVGLDPIGDRLANELATQGVDVSRMRRAKDAATSLAFAWKDERGDGHFWLQRAADLLLSPADVDDLDIERITVLVVCSIALAGEPSRSAMWRAAQLASTAGIPLCFDVNLRPSLWQDLRDALAACLPVFRFATLVKLSLDDARGLFGPTTAPQSAFDRVEELAPRAAIVLTDGERGSWFRDEAGDLRRVPAWPVTAIEPTGAGDAFTAALLMRLAEREWAPPNLDDLRVAAAAGALATTRPGAWDGLPSRTELDRFMADRSDA
jgi:sugar/nucleoside kinase (ribokinase family)